MKKLLYIFTFVFVFLTSFVDAMEATICLPTKAVYDNMCNFFSTSDKHTLSFFSSTSKKEIIFCCAEREFAITKWSVDKVTKRKIIDIILSRYTIDYDNIDLYNSDIELNINPASNEMKIVCKIILQNLES